MNQIYLQAKDRKGGLSGLIMVLCALFFLILLLPVDVVGYNDSTYDVGGANLKEVKDNIFGASGLGPVDKEGKRRAGQAILDYFYNYFYSCQPAEEKCVVTIDSVKTKLECTILLPKWTAYDQATQEAKNEWDRFIAALKKHEEGHCEKYLTDQNKQNVQTAATGALQGQQITINKPCPEDCNNPDSAFSEALETAVQNLLNNNQNFQNVFNGMEQVQDQYDTDTKHGETQNAVLRVPRN